MERPSILLVDDEPAVLSALAQDVAGEYGARYRIVRAGSGAEALAALRRLKARGAPVALIVSDQRMPDMTGVQFLEQAIQLVPDVKRVLLTAYADTAAAVRAINEIRLDYYLSKPWQPPEEQLFPILSDLLNDWQAATPAPTDGLRLLGHRWSALAHEIKSYLARNLVPYHWMDVETSAEARHLVALAGAQPTQLPLVLFPDGSHLAQPTIAQLAGRLGLRMHAERPSYDLIIVGAGPGGLAAAVYGASEGLRTLLIEREAPGGQAGLSSRIENYLGFPSGLSGGDLARRAVAQATRFGAEILTPQEAVGLRLQDGYRIVRLADGSEVSCQALLIASGVSYRKLDVPGADRLAGAGVYYGAAIPEALDSAGKDVFVVGGGNSAGQAAVYLAKYARTVTILVRGPSLEDTMSQYLIAQIDGTPNIAVRTRTSVAEVYGDSHIESVRLVDAAAAEETVPAHALFIFIGAQPRTDWFGGLVERDAHGFILSGVDLMRDGLPPRGWALERDPFWLETSVPGIFVVGDVRHGSVKRIASAAGEGAMAVQFVHQHLAAPTAPHRSAEAMAQVEHLRSAPVFASLAARDLELLAEMAQLIEVPAGQLVIREGEKGDTLYIVVDGELEVFTGRGGRDVRIAVLGPGQVVGEMAVLQDAPRNASVKTLGSSRLLVISQAALLRMLTKNPAALKEILRTFAQRMRETEAIVMQQSKLAALGTLAAGLAHQLNNPAAAVAGAVTHLADALFERDRANQALGELGLDADQRARLDVLRQEAAHARSGPEVADPIARSDCEEKLIGWLEARRVERPWEIVQPLVAAGWDPTSLEALAAGIPPPSFPHILHWLASVTASQRALDEIASSATRISELVEAVRIHSSLDRTPLQRMDVRECLENTLVILRHRITPGIRIAREFATDLPPVEAHLGELNQVWTSLVDNAIDAVSVMGVGSAAGGTGEITLRASRQGEDVLVEVTDNGLGIPPEVQGHLFEPFYTTKDVGKGTGLGLFIARKVVERAGGEISVRSRPGETTFQVRLPAAQVASQAPPAPEPTAPERVAAA